MTLETYMHTDIFNRILNRARIPLLELNAVEESCLFWMQFVLLFFEVIRIQVSSTTNHGFGSSTISISIVHLVVLLSMKCAKGVCVSE